MENKKLYILPISNINDVSKTIYQLKRLLKDTEHEIHLLTNSIAVYISKNAEESNNDINMSKIMFNEIKQGNIENDVIIKDNIKYNNNYSESSNYTSSIEVNETAYMQFMHDIKMIQRTKKLYL